MSKPEWMSQTNQQVFLILLVGFIFRSIIALWLPPGFDEAYYYIYTQHLDWSYFDHPPLVALTTGIGDLADWDRFAIYDPAWEFVAL
jgi:hypothetical protein